jgi:hypothetical protein
MNKYRVTTFTCGQSQCLIVEGYDIVNVLQSGMFNPADVVKVEFIDSSNIVDMTSSG